MNCILIGHRVELVDYFGSELSVLILNMTILNRMQFISELKLYTDHRETGNPKVAHNEAFPGENSIMSNFCI